MPNVSSPTNPTRALTPAGPVPAHVTAGHGAAPTPTPGDVARTRLAAARRTLLSWVALLLATVVVAGCGGGGSSNAQSNLRLVNATRGATLTATFNGSSAFAGIAPASASAYQTLNSGSYTVTVSSASGAQTSVTQSVTLGGSQTYSLLVYETQGALKLTPLNETQAAPVAGYGSLAASNVSSDPGALDVYVTTAGTTSLTGLSPALANVSGTSLFATMPAGTYDVFVTAQGSRTDVRLALKGVVVASGQTQILALPSTGSGALVDGVLLAQSAGALFLPNTSARLRLVSALPAAGATPVAAQVGGTSLVAVYAPSPGNYTLVPASTGTYGVTVGGAALAGAPAANFVAGTDYTLLVYGTAGAPQAALLTDDNHPPASGLTSLRLVNGTSSVGGGLSAFLNNQSVANAVALGSASGYTSLLVPSAATLQIVQAGTSPLTTSVALTQTAVYSIFVVDGSLTPYLTRDR